VPLAPQVSPSQLQTLKKEQKKSKNESDQEETTDAWGFEKPSTSGIPQTPQKVKTISWKQGIGGIRNSIHDGELENLWIGENHDTATLALTLTLLSKPSTATFFSTWLTSCTRLVPLAPQVSPSQLNSKEARNRRDKEQYT
jgi:hypothetical protein